MTEIDVLDHPMYAHDGTKPQGQKEGEVRNLAKAELKVHFDDQGTEVGRDTVLGPEDIQAELDELDADDLKDDLDGGTEAAAEPLSLSSLSTAAQKTAQARVIRAALLAAQAHIIEANTSGNRTMVNDWWQAMFGWGEDQPYCAMGVCMVASDANVLAKKDMSAGAHALNDHLKSLGLLLHNPEPGGTIAYNWGHGHIETVVALDSDPHYVRTVGFNTDGGHTTDGGGCYYLRRYMPGQLYTNAPFCRLPGVQAGLGGFHVPSWYTRVLYNRAPNPLLPVGADVKHVQSKIGAHQDGAFGADTERRLKLWEKAHGLPQDGSVRNLVSVHMP